MTLEICTTSGQADQRLRDATHALANLREDYATELAALDRRIGDPLPRATVDQSRKPELAEAISERDGLIAAARMLAEERASLNEQITHYTRQVESLKQQERVNVISDADQRLASALADHRAAVRQLVAAHRAVLNIARQNQGIPGANSMLPDGFHKLHLPNTVPVSWQGCTGEVMRDGLLPLESDAIEAEKRREREQHRIASDAEPAGFEVVEQCHQLGVTENPSADASRRDTDASPRVGCCLGQQAGVHPVFPRGA